MTTLTVQDESMTGQGLEAFTFEVPAEQITVEELLRSRVYQEAKDAQVKLAIRPSRDAIVPPADEEVLLNGVRNGQPEPIDWRIQFDKALEAFQSNRVLVFVNDRQVTSLDEVITIDRSTDIRFLRLTMLMGG